jgi:hypothetical protein
MTITPGALGTFVFISDTNVRMNLRRSTADKAYQLIYHRSSVQYENVDSLL